MEKQTIMDSVQAYFEAAGVETEARGAVLTYVADTSGAAPMPEVFKRKVDHAVLAKVCKPVFAAIAGMDKKSEAFGAAYRFWEYLQQGVAFDLSASYDEVMREFMRCGLTLKEAMLLDLVVTDFRPARISPFRSCSYQTEVMKECLKNDPAFFAEIRQTLYGLTEAEILLSERTRYYYAAFLYGTVVTDMQAAGPDSDFKAMFAALDRFFDLVGKRVVNDLAWYFQMAPFQAMVVYLRQLGKRGNAVELFQKEKDSVIPYRMQLFCFCHRGYIRELDDFRQKLLDDETYMDTVLTADAFVRFSGDGLYPLLEACLEEATDARKKQVMRRIFVDQRTADFSGEGQFERLNDYLQKIDDPQTVLNVLLYSRSKKAVGLCASIVSGRKKEFAQAVRDAAGTKLSKDNAQAVKAVLDKWNDEESAESGFADLAAVEAYAKGEKLTAAKLLSQFDFTVPVYGADKTTRVSEQTLKVFVDKYFSMKEIYRNRRCDLMAAHFDPVSFGAFIDTLYAVWEGTEFDNKLKAAVVPYCFYTSNANLLKLKKQCVTFCDAGRHTLSSYIIQVMAMNGGKYALMLVDGIANKFPYPKAKQVARDAMANAAAKYEIPVDVLGDMIIPTCDFDACGTQVWGGLTLTLLPDGDVRIDRGGKTLKSLPSDTDPETKKRFSALKKDVKTVMQLQTVRLERALMMGRSWTYKDFTRTFVRHPVMRLLVNRLILGSYTPDGKLEAAFRIGLDGRAENADYDEVTPQDGDVVALLHPCDLDEASLSAWRTYLGDNEIAQPFPQLLQTVCFAPKALIKDKTVDLKAYGFNHSHIQKLVKKYNMTRLSVEDAGCFAGYYLEDAGSDVGFELIMDGLFVMCDPTDGSDLAVAFYKPSTTPKDYWTHAQASYMPPDTVPTRLISSVLSSLAAVMPGLPFEQNGTVVPCKFAPFVNENEPAVEDPTPIVPASASASPRAEAAAACDAAPQSAPKAAPKAPAPQKAPAAADGPVEHAAYLEFVEGTSSKFWKIEVRGDSHTVTFGRIGTAGTQSVKSFASPSEAIADAKKLTAAKLKKGYVQK